MIDRANIVIRAGKGGDGIVHFHRAKYIPKGGPDGGDGGRGGSVYVMTDTNLATLDQFAFREKFEAENGKPGEGRLCSGRAGEDLYIKVPVGTIVKLTKPSGEEKIIDFDKEGMEELVAKGGKGGKGNWHFRSSTNTTPREATPGEAAEEWQAELDLKVLADVGLVGLPNVGKSTLLSVLTKARPKIADYEFTTLSPNLGVTTLFGEAKSRFAGGINKGARQVVIADIPGLIEGASLGKGLGMDFLRHVERTKLLVHVLALKGLEIDLPGEVMVEQLAQNYQVVRSEMLGYKAGLEKKREIVVLNKTDLLDPEKVEQVVAGLDKRGIKVLAISCGTLLGVEELKKRLFTML